MFAKASQSWFPSCQKDWTSASNPKQSTHSSSIIFIYLVYIYFDKWNSITAYIDNLTTAIFFVGMWLMAKRKIENWIFWIIGDVISVPLYYYKGLTFTSLQYLIFTFIAIAGYYSWKKILNKPLQTALK